MMSTTRVFHTNNGIDLCWRLNDNNIDIIAKNNKKHKLICSVFDKEKVNITILTKNIKVNGHIIHNNINVVYREYDEDDIMFVLGENQIDVYELCTYGKLLTRQIDQHISKSPDIKCICQNHDNIMKSPEHTSHVTGELLCDKIKNKTVLVTAIEIIDTSKILWSTCTNIKSCRLNYVHIDDKYNFISIKKINDTYETYIFSHDMKTLKRIVPGCFLYQEKSHNIISKIKNIFFSKYYILCFDNIIKFYDDKLDEIYTTGAGEKIIDLDGKNLKIAYYEDKLIIKNIVL